MSALFSSFPKTSKEEWVDLLQKELKGASPDTLQKFNRIEEISLPSYFHREDAPAAFSDPGLAPFTRGTQRENNDWLIGTCFRIGTPKETNAELLDALMKGTTSLVLHATNKAAIDFDQLLAEIGLEFIQTTFYPQTEEQALAFIAKAGTFPSSIVFPRSVSWLKSAAAATKDLAVKPFAVNAFAVQQVGATTWQELAIALAEGHEYLVEQLELGLTVDEAAANIHFVLGTGNKYFYEISKFRAFRTAWSRIVAEYEPQHTCSQAAYITAKTGFMYVSIKDPYTNLLRQTTEAMSAVIGGANALVIQPFDWYSLKPNVTFSRRMATNISLLLKEESYLSNVIDPAGGSYALDSLTNAITERAWAGFQEIERNGGLDSIPVKLQLSEEIKAKVEQRMTLFNEKKETLIGINTFPNPQTVDNEWHNVPTGWNNLPLLIVETQIQQA